MLQIEGIDHDETFASVTKVPSLRTTHYRGIAAERNLEVHQMEVNSAYLNGELCEEIFMEVPPGFDVFGRDGVALFDSAIDSGRDGDKRI